MSKKARRKGRRRKRRYKGYWYRKGRGWYTTEGRRSVPLTTEDGEHLKDPGVEGEAKTAYARYLLGRENLARRQANGDTKLVGEVCRIYLDYCKAEDRESTFRTRADFLFDFCTGFPAKFREKKKPTPQDRLHKGCGKKAVGDLIPSDIDEWFSHHPGWNAGTRKIAIQAVKRALNYAAERKIIRTNPIRGFPVPKSRKRRTYFTPEREEQIYARSSKAFALAVKVLIRTGARYGCEFCQLEAKHVEETRKGQVWRFSADEAKTHKPRTIYVADDIAEIVRRQIKKYPKGPLFRNSQHNPWTPAALKKAFGRLRKSLKDAGLELDKDDCLYSTRHTFAKRTLGGYWTGKNCTIEQLAAVMGNTRQICWEHYAQWCDNYIDPLWEAVNG